MTFGESISTCFSKYATFEGRATRPEFWWWILFVVLASAVTTLMGNTISGIFSLATLLPGLAVTARRLHDIDRSGWWQLVGLVPLIGWVVMIVWCCQEASESNRFGAAADVDL